jgi:hypothetical protein
MSILSRLGFGKVKSAEEVVELTFDEYFSRFVRIKGLVEANPQIIVNINNVFSHEYLEEKLNSDLMFLGWGNMHSVYSIYEGSISDKGHDISLALRLANVQNRFIYSMLEKDGDAIYRLFSELNSFSEAFIKGKNPAYFMGLVGWYGPNHFRGGIAGFITEDLTKRKTLKSTRQNDNGFEEYLIVNNKNKTTMHFIDRVLPDGYHMDIEKYRDNLIKVNYSSR